MTAYDNKSQNQRALGASLFMLWLKSVLISWTCWIKVQLNSVYVNFQDLWNKFSFISWQLRDKKTCASWWELEKRLCGLKEGWVEVIRQTVSFLLACVCLWSGGWAGWALLVIKCCTSSKLVTLIIAAKRLRSQKHILAKLHYFYCSSRKMSVSNKA